MSVSSTLGRQCAVTDGLRLDEIVAVGRADEPVRSVADVLHAIQAYVPSSQSAWFRSARLWPGAAWLTHASPLSSLGSEHTAELARF